VNLATVELRGGLGNQLFQVCAALTARSMGYSVELNSMPLEADVKRDLAVSDVAKQLGIPVVSRPSDRFSSRLQRKSRVVLTDPTSEFGDVGRLLTASSGDVILRGYFQDRINVSAHVPVLNDVLQSIFGFRNQEQHSRIALHIRRGDYVTEKVTSEFHGNLGSDYYESALRESQFQHQIDSVLAYSDDVEFVSEEFLPAMAPIFPNVSFHTRIEPFEDPLAELFFLSRHCSHVIANSSFSWWAATLSQSSSVVGPSRWWASSAAPRSDQLRWPGWTWL